MQWTTVERGRPAARWGLRPGEYTNVALASLDTYTRGDMCGGASASLHTMTVLVPCQRGHRGMYPSACKPWASSQQGVISFLSRENLPLALPRMLGWACLKICRCWQT